MSGDEEGNLIYTFLWPFILLTWYQYDPSRVKESYKLWVLVWCTTVFSSRTVYTARTIHVHKVVAENVVKKDLVGSRPQ